VQQVRERRGLVRLLRVAVAQQQVRDVRRLVGGELGAPLREQLVAGFVDLVGVRRLQLEAHAEHLLPADDVRAQPVPAAGARLARLHLVADAFLRGRGGHGGAGGGGERAEQGRGDQSGERAGTRARAC
jgi:hypothetical protein